MTIRKLPNGLPCPITDISLQGKQLAGSLPDSDGPEFDWGDLVEVQSAEGIYLGAIQGRSPSRFVVGIEHFLPQAALDQIASRWHNSPPA